MDKNGGHFLENMSLFGLVTPEDAGIPSSEFVEKLSNEQRGTLCFPLNGLLLDIECGRDGLCMQLKNSIHLADKSRGTTNFSSTKWKRK